MLFEQGQLFLAQIDPIDSGITLEYGKLSKH